jgi:murein DD-endopeptidase MepM/ murein hydrolase activator NlpD
MPLMTSPLRRSATAFLVFALASTTAISPASSQVSDADVEAARAVREAAASERAAALADLDQAVAAYEAVRGELEALTFSIGRLRGRIDSYEGDTLDLRAEVQERAVQSYMNGDERDPIARVFSPATVQQSIIAREVLSQAVESESEQLLSLAATTAEMARLREELETESVHLAELRAESDAIVARMNELYEEADLVFDDADQEYVEVKAERAEVVRREEEARRLRELRQAALEVPAEGVPEWVTPGFICPVGGFSWFTNSWGAPRSGGRSHKGVDMMGPIGTPLVAVASGIVRKSYGTLGGNIVWLYADHGVNYFYAHLDGYPGGLGDGQWVARGQVIGYMGDTGNPAPGAYHLHFGIYPGGITAVNPYPSVERVCP